MEDTTMLTEPSSYYVPLTEFTTLEVSGKDSLSFLQGQLSCDVSQVNEKMSALGCCCDRKGRILFSFRILKTAENNYYLYLPKSMAQFALEHLSKYIIIAKLSLNIKESSCIGLGGKEIINWLKTEYSEVPEKLGGVSSSQDRILINIDEKNPRYLQLENAFSPPELSAMNSEYWSYLDIQQGLVSIYPETQGLFIPQMLNYDQFGAISFTKGCFVGQEIIARTQHLGKLKRHLHLLEKEFPVDKGAELLDENHQNIGTVAACSINPKGKYSLLAVLKD